MPFRVSFFFTQRAGDRTGGWSENYWSNLGSIDAAMTAAINLIPALSKLHGRTTVLSHVRVSNVDNFRQILINTFPGTDNPNVTATTLSDYPTTALGLRWRSLPNYTVRQWVRGTWDSVVDQGGAYIPTPTFNTNVSNFFAAMTNASNGWALRVLDATTPRRVVTDITQAGVVTVAAHGYANNSRVRISRAKGLTQANQIWRITVIDANSFSLQGWVVPSVVTPYQGNGEARLQTYVFPAISSGIVERATKRNVGRPFALLSGRAKNRTS